MKTVMSTYVQRSIRTAVLVSCLGYCLAGAQEYPSDLKASLIASSESGKTLDLSDGRIFTFRQLVELPESEREALLELSKKRSAHANFREWVNATAEARLEETKKAYATSLVKAVKSFQELTANCAKCWLLE